MRTPSFIERKGQDEIALRADRRYKIPPCKSRSHGSLSERSQSESFGLASSLSPFFTLTGVAHFEPCSTMERLSGGTCTLMNTLRILLVTFLAIGSGFAADLTGNWVAESPSHDGYVRKSYFDLKQEDSHVTGHIRTGQFYYTISESSGTPDDFTITGSM